MKETFQEQEIKYKSKQSLKFKGLRVAEIPGFNVRNGCTALCYQRILLRNKNGWDVWGVVGYFYQKEMVRVARCSLQNIGSLTHRELPIKKWAILLYLMPPAVGNPETDTFSLWDFSSKEVCIAVFIWKEMVLYFIGHFLGLSWATPWSLALTILPTYSAVVLAAAEGLPQLQTHLLCL